MISEIDLAFTLTYPYAHIRAHNTYTCTPDTYEHTYAHWIFNDTDTMHMLLFIGHSGLGGVVELDLCFKEGSQMLHPYLVADIHPAQVSGLN